MVDRHTSGVWEWPWDWARGEALRRGWEHDTGVTRFSRVVRKRHVMRYQALRPIAETHLFTPVVLPVLRSATFALRVSVHRQLQGDVASLRFVRVD